MKFNRVLLLPTILAFTSPLFAQHPQHRGAAPGGAAVHPGQPYPGQSHQQHALTPEEQYHHMMQQFWYEQTMIDEMYRMSRTRPGQSQSRQGTAFSPSQRNQNSSEPSSHAALNKSDASHKAISSSTGSAREQSSPTSDKHAHHSEKESKKGHHDEDRAKEKIHDHRAELASRRTEASDSAAIGLLRTVHSRLHRADPDYGGHRVRSMEHISAAVRQLGGAPLIDAGPAFVAADLPQAQSDEILRDASHTLHRVELMLATGANRAEHHHRARVSVTEAMREIQTALAVR